MKNSIKILGAYGAKTLNTAMTCVQVDDEILIDAGNILLGLDKEAKNINHIFLTHTHLDHIVDIPFLIDIYFESRVKPLTIYGLKGSIENVKKYIFNWAIWPDFSNIPLTTGGENSIIFQTIEVGEEIEINDVKLKSIKTVHTESSCGYVITKGGSATLFTADTYKCQNIWDETNNNPLIKSVIIDVSFPSILQKLAFDSKHLTPDLLNEELETNLLRDDVMIFINHIKPIFLDEIKDEIKTKFPNFLRGGRIINDGDILNLKTCEIKENLTKTQLDKIHINQLIDIGYSLTSEKDFDALMEKILVSSKKLSNADGGTLYLMSDDEKNLEFKVVHTDSLNIQMGGKSGAITWPSVKLFNPDGSQNWEQVAALCAISGKLINIPDVYEAEGFNFEGTKKFDAGTGYRTTSMLVVPMKNHENKVIGVLQLLNKTNETNEIIGFTGDDEKLILSMSSQAAVSISNNRLIAGLEKLLMDFIKSTADAISEKSKYTGGHINRVAEIATLIAKEINNDTETFKDKTFTEDELQQIDIAAWMHDIGKITTPEYVVDKATKLETIYDRIETVLCKCEILKRDIEIEYLKNTMLAETQEEKDHLTKLFEELKKEIDENIKFLKIANKGSEFMSDEFLLRLHTIASKDLIIDGKVVELLTENELYNLSIREGTLTAEERTIINNHVTVSYNMLNKLTFPKKLQRVPVIAGSHHKTIKTDENGKHFGYGAPAIMDLPMSLEDRMLAVADVFEAITASDRPYKDPNSLNHSLQIMASMAKNDELDYTLVKFFIDKKIYEEYSINNLKKEQIDIVTVKL
ncbi:MAG: MBL fold metallo-hydrolase [Arcobacteraceae bacterium]|nr:MBL fold metallo-hydrolase [Arcobacteraceae bacterium]